MKKIIFTFAFALLTFASVNAQEFNVGTNVINLGVGLGGHYTGYYSSNSSPVISVSYERGVWDVPGPGVVSLGGYIGHKTYKYSSLDSKWSQTVAGVRGAYHYNGFDVENLDVYAGIMLGYNFYSNSSGPSFNYGNTFNHSGFVGGRWYFTDAIAAYLEAGYGISNISAGIAFRF